MSGPQLYHLSQLHWKKIAYSLDEVYKTCTKLVSVGSRPSELHLGGTVWVSDVKGGFLA